MIYASWSAGPEDHVAEPAAVVRAAMACQLPVRTESPRFYNTTKEVAKEQDIAIPETYERRRVRREDFRLRTRRMEKAKGEARFQPGASTN